MLKLLIDECIGKRLYRLLIEKDFNLKFVGDWKRGATDEEIIRESIKEKAIIVTEDKDFGEMIFRRKLKPHGIVLFRTETANPYHRLSLLKEVLKRVNPASKIIVITEKIIKIRKIN